VNLVGCQIALFWRYVNKQFIIQNVRFYRENFQLAGRLGRIIARPFIPFIEYHDMLPKILKEDIYSESINNASKLKVTSNTTYYLKPGDVIQLNIDFVNNMGQLVNLSANNNKYLYTLNVPSNIAEVDSQGIITIKSTPIPVPNATFPLLVLVANDSISGIGQFGIIDDDSDNDQIVDSFEIKYGFDPNTPNFGDYDGDSLSDFFELLIGSNPVMKDTD